MTSGNLDRTAPALHPMQDVRYGTKGGTRQQRIVCVLILCLALSRGLLYAFIVPPWQHYDEPGHFEYAWLIANRFSLPQPGDYDRGMRREVANSMLEQQFYRDMSSSVELLETDEPIQIGLMELHHPPLYYMLVSPLLSLLSHADVTVQLYAARAVSLLLYLCSVWIGCELVGELVPRGHPLRWAVPGMMALLPAYTDLMTAVQNDVGAAAIFSLFLWGAVRTIVRGVSLLHLSWVVGTAALCAWTKNTASVAVVLVPLVVALTWSRFAWTRWVWCGVLVAGLLLTVAIFAWGNAAAWYQFSADPGPTSQRVADAPWGKRAIAQRSVPGEHVAQSLSQEDVEALRGMTVTLGAWVWAAQPAQVRSPMLYDGQQHTWRAIAVNEIPTFYAVEATISDDADFVQVMLYSSLDYPNQDDITVYYDGLALAEGVWDGSPVFDDARGRTGTWGGRPFVNRVRNGSAEGTGPRARPWIDKPMMRYARRSPTHLLTSILDWKGTRSIYPKIWTGLLPGFWARFGWDHIGLPAAWYWILGALTVTGVSGAIVAGARSWRSERHLPRTWAMALLAAASLLVWGNAVLRLHPAMFRLQNLMARYTFPAIIPTVLALVGGWWALTPRRFRRWLPWALFSLLGVLDVASLWTIWTFFYGR